MKKVCHKDYFNSSLSMRFYNIFVFILNWHPFSPCYLICISSVPWADTWDRRWVKVDIDIKDMFHSGDTHTDRVVNENICLFEVYFITSFFLLTPLWREAWRKWPGPPKLLYTSFIINLLLTSQKFQTSAFFVVVLFGMFPLHCFLIF